MRKEQQDMSERHCKGHQRDIRGTLEGHREGQKSQQDGEQII